MSKIEWTDETWNPLVGCSHVSPGCDNCYAAREASGRLRGVPVYIGLAEDGRFTGEVRTLPERLDQPLRWRKPRLVFVNSMSDLFHVDVPAEFIAEVFAVMAATKRHTYQVLTKRPQQMARLLSRYSRCEHGWLTHNGENPIGYGGDGVVIPIDTPGMQHAWPLPNVWLGTSIESNWYTFRADHLRATPAAVRFLSLEPLLGPLPSIDLTGIDWVIVGGESGPNARPMHPGWARDIRDRCQAAGVPFFFKQWGEWAPAPWKLAREEGESLDHYKTRSDAEAATHALTPAGHMHELPHRPWSVERSPLDHSPTAGMRRVGKKAAGRNLDGRTWDETPAAAT